MRADVLPEACGEDVHGRAAARVAHAGVTPPNRRRRTMPAAEWPPPAHVSACLLARMQLAFARGCADIWHLHRCPHLQAVSLVLETALSGCTEAAISEVTLRCPPFLAAWAARWLPCSSGQPTPPRVSLTILQGYRVGHAPLRATTVYNLGQPTIISSPAHATIYVPHQ